jgi:hypothetical protein
MRACAGDLQSVPDPENASSGVIGGMRRILSRCDVSTSIREEGGVSRIYPAKAWCCLAISRQRREKTLPTSRRQSDECSRRQGTKPLPEKEISLEHWYRIRTGSVDQTKRRFGSTCEKAGHRRKAQDCECSETDEDAAAPASVIARVQCGEASLPILWL